MYHDINISFKVVFSFFTIIVSQKCDVIKNNSIRMFRIKKKNPAFFYASSDENLNIIIEKTYNIRK